MLSLNKTRIFILISLRNTFFPIFFIIIIYYFETSFKKFLCFSHQSHKARNLKNQRILKYLYKNSDLLIIVFHPYPKETYWTISGIKIFVPLNMFMLLFLNFSVLGIIC